jgi:hypothetical protein
MGRSVPIATVSSATARRYRDVTRLVRPILYGGVGVAVLTACNSHPHTSSAPATSPAGSPAVVTSGSAVSPGAVASASTSAASAAATSAGAASASSTQLPAASGSSGLPVPGATGSLAIFADVLIKGAFSDAETGVVAAEGPDGAVFVAGAVASPQIVWVVDGTSPAGVAEHVTGPVTALAADANNLYVGVGKSVSAFSRTTGALVRTWNEAALFGTVTQLAVAGNRVWGLYTASGDGPPAAPAALVEIDPSSNNPARTVTGITGAFSIAAGTAGIYYVNNNSTQVVEQSNDGRTLSAPTKQAVDLQLSGPSAIQAVAVVGGHLVLQHDAGQGLDAVLNTYDAGTLSGPSMPIPFSAAEQLLSTPSGLFVVGNPETGACTSGQQTCVRRFSLASDASGYVGTSVALPDDTEASTLVGPYPTAVVGEGSDLHVLRIS